MSPIPPQWLKISFIKKKKKNQFQQKFTQLHNNLSAPSCSLPTLQMSGLIISFWNRSLKSWGIINDTAESLTPENIFVVFYVHGLIPDLPVFLFYHRTIIISPIIPIVSSKPCTTEPIPNNPRRISSHKEAPWPSFRRVGKVEE